MRGITMKSGLFLCLGIMLSSGYLDAEEVTGIQQDQTSAILQAVETWREKWSSGDADGYFSAYAADFHPEKTMSFATWKKHKQSLFHARKDIHVKTVNIHIKDAGDANHVVVSFYQQYNSKAYNSIDNKELTLSRQEGAWKIVRERVIPFPRVEVIADGGANKNTDNPTTDQPTAENPAEAPADQNSDIAVNQISPITPASDVPGTDTPQEKAATAESGHEPAVSQSTNMPDQQPVLTTAKTEQPAVAAEQPDDWNQSADMADLSTIFRDALKNDPELRSSVLETEAQEDIRKQARAGFLPTMSLKASRTETYQNITSSDNVVFAAGKTHFPTNDVTLTLRQPVFHYDALISYRQSETNVKKSQIERAASRQDMIIRVVDAYLTVLFSQDDVTRARAEKSAVEHNLKFVEAKQRAGQASRADVLEARARYGAVQALMVETQDALARSLDGLQMISGHPVVKIASLDATHTLPRPDPEDVGEWVDAAGTDNLKVQAQKMAVDVAEKEVARLQAGHYPTVDLVGRYNYKDTKGTLFGGGSKVGTADVLVELNVPILEGGRVVYKVREAEVRYQQAKQHLEKLRRDAKREARSSFSSAVSGLSKMDALRMAVEAQEGVLQVKQQGMLSGLNTSLEVLDVQRNLFFARREYAKARYDYLKYNLHLKKSVGRLSDSDIETLNHLLHHNGSDS